MPAIFDIADIFFWGNQLAQHMPCLSNSVWD